MKGLNLLLRIIKYIFVIFIIFISLAPFIWVLLSSFKTNGEIMSAGIWLPKELRISNYVNAFKLAPLAQFYVNSIIVGIFGTLFNIAILSMSAYVIARFDFKFKKILVPIFSLALLIPGAALLQPLYLTTTALGLYDKLIGLIIVYAGFGLPTTLYILTSYFLTIPKELEESSYLDGAGFVKTFTNIILPISKPGIVTAAVLQFLLCWSEFQFALTLTTGNKSRTLPLALYYFKSQFGSNYGVMFAASVIVIIPSIIVFVLLQRQVISGLTAGAVKG